VETLRDALLTELEQGRASPAVLQTLGESDPSRAAESFRRAASEPDLASTLRDWVPDLLLTARPGFGAQCLEELARRYRHTTGRPLDLTAVPALPRVLGSSDFLARLLLRHPNWADELIGRPPPLPPADSLDADWTSIRIAKYQALLRIAARDLFDRDFEQSLRELSDLADRGLDAALRCAARETGVEPPALLALGKLGGRELNFSSDVDLLFLYEAGPTEDHIERNDRVCRLVRTLKQNLEARGEDGFAFRVDLDLRPEGRTGTLANSVDAALTYYETFGAEWERQMLIRGRWVAGPTAPARAFLDEVGPFVYRRLIDPSAVGAVREMKDRIEAERRRSGRDLDFELKEGPGGIRDVEFLVQALQLFHGAREEGLRTGNVPDALRGLGKAGILPEDVAESLLHAYLWLRRTEHALQMVEERQTHRFPRDARAQIALARRMGYRDEEADAARNRLLDEWTNTRAEVRSQFEALVLAGGAQAGEAT
jgi:glutamate-ammonia-ligase adenylyltransferase